MPMQGVKRRGVKRRATLASRAHAEEGSLHSCRGGITNQRLFKNVFHETPDLWFLRGARSRDVQDVDGVFTEETGQRFVCLS